MRVALIGGAGFLGRATAAHLRAAGHAVLVVDLHAGGAAPFARVDLCDAFAYDALSAALRDFGADAVVHLAARVNLPRTGVDRDAARRLHVQGTEAVVTASAGAGVRHLTLVSSATVYGAWPDHPAAPPFLDETAPPRPNPGFTYAEDKHDQERIVRGAAALGAPFAVTVARPALLAGPGARSYLTDVLRRAPFLPALDGHRPPLQFLHVDDCARALVGLVGGRVAGTFNVAPVDAMAYADVAAARGLRVVDLPSRLVGPVLDALAPFVPDDLRTSSALLPHLMFPFALDATALTRATSWRPRVTSAFALG